MVYGGLGKGRCCQVEGCFRFGLWCFCFSSVACSYGQLFFCLVLAFWIRRCEVYLLWRNLLDLSFIYHGLDERFETKQ